MAVQIDRVVSQLRALMVSGELQPGDRIIELQFAARLGVSRTPLRLAMVELEKEGLLERLPSRGFRVRGFSVEDVADAVDVRGVLEGMAARLVAEHKPSDRWLTEMQQIVADGHALLAPAREDPRTTIDAREWGQINQRFHALLIDEAGNKALASALEHNNRTPLTGPAALTLPVVPSALETAFVLRAQADHEDLLTAISRGEAARAESLAREHAYRSRENKRKLIEQMRRGHFGADGQDKGAESLLGITLGSA